MKTILLALVCASAAGVASAATHVGIGLSFGVPPPVHVHRAPPPRIVERVVVSPGPGYVWVPGHYTWAGDRWIWMTGTWVLPPRPDARWIDGSWSPQSQQWVEGHWEIVAAPPPPPPPTVVVPSSAPAVVVPTPAPVVTQYSDVVVPDAPPAPPTPDVQLPAPGPGYLWVSGYWGWENGRREWFRGHWERPPHGYREWISPRWEHRANGYVFVRGYWR